jgi:hypothetical protein
MDVAQPFQFLPTQAHQRKKNGGESGRLAFGVPTDCVSGLKKDQQLSNLKRKHKICFMLLSAEYSSQI